MEEERRKKSKVRCGVMKKNESGRDREELLWPGGLCNHGRVPRLRPRHVVSNGHTIYDVRRPCDSTLYGPVSVRHRRRRWPRPAYLCRSTLLLVPIYVPPPPLTLNHIVPDRRIQQRLHNCSPRRPSWYVREPIQVVRRRYFVTSLACCCASALFIGCREIVCW